MPARPTLAQSPGTPAAKRHATRLNAPFTKAQQAILQLLNRPLSDEQLADIQQLIGQYLADQTDTLGQQAWDEKGYTQADMDNLLNTHLRTPYNKR